MQTLTKKTTQLYNCTTCNDVGYYTIACGNSHNTIFCTKCSTGHKAAINSNSTDRRIH